MTNGNMRWTHVPQIPDLNLEPQDADYSDVPELCNDLKIMIMARTPRFQYGRLLSLNRQFSRLFRSGEIFKIRRWIGFCEPSVFIRPVGDSCWWASDRDFKSYRKLPEFPFDECFRGADKETLCAGTHLLVSGRNLNGFVLWRYELEKNEWYQGPSMISPRCLYGSASSGTYAYVAGGKEVKPGSSTDPVEVWDTAEKYDQETRTWVSLPRMHKKRHLCSGCFMDHRFYVLGGRDEKGNKLTCGEFFDEDENVWTLVPDILNDTMFFNTKSPPLIAVVSNNLYALETSSNDVRVYCKATNTWRMLGPAPLQAGSSGGWGVAFKSLGEELLVMGKSLNGNSMAVYTCKPSEQGLAWKEVECSWGSHLSHFIHNCSVMVA